MPRPPSFRRASAATPSAQSPRHGLARVLSKLGACSRSQAEQWIRAGRVSVDGHVVRDPYQPTLIDRHRLAVDGQPVQRSESVYVAFNKPRGIVVSAADEHGRATVYTALAAAGLPWLGPVGRLDKASEGLLLLSNDTTWAAGITDPATHLEKTYHVQVAGQPDAAVLQAMLAGVEDAGDRLKARKATLLRVGDKNAWLEVVLDEGRNRHIRRLLAALGFDVLRLIRVAIGPLVLGELAKGQWRRLDQDEVRALVTKS
ncbi:Pseudouridine synthase [Rhodanobacter sp. Root179]|uniref:pseudouridine synthase n=1 Tax=Rhodanobacter sp. Root179 TaxID=1736482 RepID=UPI0006FB5467|nr:pseudouridine synthase [Rhodanobacter sp. Root179]KRB41080.1 pseudouridine synthase [Rhodanobacter sp. Root179]